MKSEPRHPSCNEGSLHKLGIFKSLSVLLQWSLALLLLLQLKSSSWNIRDTTIDRKVQLTAEQHTIPTLLSVVDGTTKEYKNALNNPLYPLLKKATFDNNSMESTSASQSPKLSLDRSLIRIRESLTLKWTQGLDKGDKPVVANDYVFVLWCRSSDISDNWVLLDAATVAEAKATHQKHGGLPDDRAWYFPSFPVLRHDFCKFSLYRQPQGNIDRQPHGNIEDGKPIYRLLAESTTLQILDAQTTPTAIHLAFGNSIDEMVVQFKTGSKGTPVVQYGHASFDHMSSGTSHTYTASDMCQAPANLTEAGKFTPPGMLHVVWLQGLEPDTTYWYRVAIQQSANSIDSPTTLWSETFSFVSAPEVKASAEPFGILVYGDQGCPARGWGDGGLYTSAMAARELDGNLPIRAVHHFGDLSYAVGVAHIWDEWLNMISTFTSRVPLMVGVGNHEYDHDGGGIGKDPSGVNSPGGYHPNWGNMHNDSGGECGVPTSQHFLMPETKGSNGVFWWSHDLASVHTIMLSSEHDLSPGSTQHEWLKSDLEAVNKTMTPWIVLEIHRPLYESEFAPWDYRVGVALRVALEDLLLEHQVDLVLAGHYHSYLRTCQGLYKGKCNNGGSLHITVGSAGASLTKNWLIPNHWTAKFIQGTYGYGRITVANSTAMHFEFVQAGRESDPNAGRVLDDVWLRKQVRIPFVEKEAKRLRFAQH